jgi:vacuolar protein sorting-associated protein 54
MASFSSTSASLSSALVTTESNDYNATDSVSKSDFSIYLHDMRDPYISFNESSSSVDGGLTTTTTTLATEDELREDLRKCQASVPEEFFYYDFDLKSPKTFRKVVTFKKLSKDDEDRPPDLVLHERLTSYLDSVEVCLLKQISSKANAFFGALRNLRHFKEEVNESCAKMRTLRRIVRLLKQSLVIDVAKVPQNRIRRRNLERLSHTVALMTEVRSTKKTVQSLLQVKDYHGALNLIDRVQSVLNEELSGLTCMRHLSRQLMKFQNLIRDTMSEHFLELAVSLDLSRHHDDDDDDNNDNDDCDDNNQNRRIRLRLELKEKLLPLVRGLLRIGYLQSTIAKYRTRVSELLTSVIKTAVSASLNETELLVAAAASELNSKDEEVKTSTTSSTTTKVSVVTQLRSLGPQGFMSLLEVVLEHLSIVTSRAAEIHRTLLSVLLDCGPASNLSHHQQQDDEDQSNKSAKSLKAKLQQEGCERDSREALEYVWKLAQRHASRMFQVRQEVHVNLSMNEIGELWHLVMAFVKTTERKTGRRGDILTNALQQQMEKQLQRVHSNQMQELVASLDSELWYVV